MSEISQELVERMAACLRRYASGENNIVGGMSVFAEANSIVAELPVPVDPDLIEARRIAGDAMAAWRVGTQGYASGAINYVRSGNDDNSIYVTTALAAIRRGRELAGERP